MTYNPTGSGTGGIDIKSENDRITVEQLLGLADEPEEKKPFKTPVLTGYQGYAKVGVRNAMVIATASACLAVDIPSRTVRLALGSVGPVILRAPEAEALAVAAADFEAGTIDEAAVVAFGAAAGRAARPIDDHRSSAAYRRRAIEVLARRLLVRAFPGGTASAAGTPGGES